MAKYELGGLENMPSHLMSWLAIGLAIIGSNPALYSADCQSCKKKFEHSFTGN